MDGLNGYWKPINRQLNPTTVLLASSDTEGSWSTPPLFIFLFNQFMCLAGKHFSFVSLFSRNVHVFQAVLPRPSISLLTGLFPIFMSFLIMIISSQLFLLTFPIMSYDKCSSKFQNINHSLLSIFSRLFYLQTWGF